MAWQKPGNLREWVGVFRRHEKKFFFTAGIVITAVLIASWWVPERKFQVEAKFSRANDPSFDQQSGLPGKPLLKPWRDSLREDLIGKPSLEKLVDDLKLTTGLTRNSDGTLTRESQLKKNEIVANIRKNLRSPSLQASDTIDQITLVYNDTDREMAPLVVNTIIDNYIRETDQKITGWLENTRTGQEKQVDRFRAEYSRLEKMRLKFLMDHQGLLPDDPSSLQTLLTAKRAALDAVTQELDRNRSQMTRVDEALKSMPDELSQRRVIENPDYRLKLQQKADLIKELDNHLTIWNRTEEHPLVKKTRERLAQVQKELDAMEKEVEGEEIKSPNVAKQQAGLELERLKGSVESLERQQSELTSQIEQNASLQRNFIEVRNQYDDMMRSLNEAKDQRDRWEKSLAATMKTMADYVASRGMRLSFHTRAYEANATSPTLVNIILVALVAGVAAGAVAVFLSELLDHSFRSIDQAVNELKLPVLGAVTEITTSTQNFRRKLVNFGLYPALGVATVLALIVALLILQMSIQEPKRFDSLVNRPIRAVIGSTATP